MNLQTCKAATMAEALTQVKTTMGADAVILHTRPCYTRPWLGLRRRAMVEITAGKGLNVGRKRYMADAAPAQAQQRGAARIPSGIAAYRSGAGAAGSATAAPSRSLARITDDGSGDSFAGAAAPRTAIEGGRALMETPAATSAPSALEPEIRID